MSHADEGSERKTALAAAKVQVDENNDAGAKAQHSFANICGTAKAMPCYKASQPNDFRNTIAFFRSLFSRAANAARESAGFSPCVYIFHRLASPHRLKPVQFWLQIGTTEVMPCCKTCNEQHFSSAVKHRLSSSYFALAGHERHSFSLIKSSC